jgi:hypothetical protein
MKITSIMPSMTYKIVRNYLKNQKNLNALTLKMCLVTDLSLDVPRWRWADSNVIFVLHAYPKDHIVTSTLVHRHQVA